MKILSLEDEVFCAGEKCLMERRTNLWSCCIAYNVPNQPKLLHLSDNDNARSPFNFPLNIIKKSVRVIKAKQKRAVCTAARESWGNKSGINGRTCHSQADIPARGRGNKNSHELAVGIALYADYKVQSTCE